MISKEPRIIAKGLARLGELFRIVGEGFPNIDEELSNPGGERPITAEVRRYDLNVPGG